MPTYQYACTECGERLEVVQKFTDDALTVCPACEGRLRKLFSPVGVVFKGSGFYKTDSRSTANKPASASAGSGASGGAPAGGDKSASGESGPSTPAKSAPAESSTPASPASPASPSSSPSGDGTKVA